MTRSRRAVLIVLLATTTGAALPSGAAAQLPPGVSAMRAAGARLRTKTLTTSPLRASRGALLLAFVVAGGTTRGERVERVSGDGLRWSPAARSDGATGATEVWQARASRPSSGRVAATFAAAAYPAHITVVAYGEPSTSVTGRASRAGRASTPSIKLAPSAGSLIWTVGLSEGQRHPSVLSSGVNRDVLMRTFEPNRRMGAWVALTTARTAHAFATAGASSSRDWHMVAVDVVVPALRRLIEEGLLTAHGAVARGSGAGAGAGQGALPPNCPAPPAFEVGVQDDPVFLGMQPAMSAARGFELATTAFKARALRLNVVWGQVRSWGWRPYDQAVQMAREHCWTVQMTIVWTPTFEEGYLNSELSSNHLNPSLMTAFGAEVASRYAGRVGRFSIGNEPNDRKFLPLNGHEIEAYDAVYLAGYRGVKSVDPSAEVLAGELAPMHIASWLPNVAALPSSGVGVHPYWLTGEVGKYAEMVRPDPVLVTEDGASLNSPDQIAGDLKLEETARRGGAKEIIFYQLSRADSGPDSRWDTGIE